MQSDFSFFPHPKEGAYANNNAMLLAGPELELVSELTKELLVKLHCIFQSEMSSSEKRGEIEARVKMYLEHILHAKYESSHPCYVAADNLRDALYQGNGAQITLCYETLITTIQASSAARKREIIRNAIDEVVKLENVRAKSAPQSLDQLWP